MSVTTVRIKSSSPTRSLQNLRVPIRFKSVSSSGLTLSYNFNPKTAFYHSGMKSDERKSRKQQKAAVTSLQIQEQLSKFKKIVCLKGKQVVELKQQKVVA